MKEYLLYYLSFSILLFVSAGYSYKFHKDFTSRSSPSKLVVALLTTIIVFSITIFSLITYDIFQTNKEKEVYFSKAHLNQEDTRIDYSSINYISNIKILAVLSTINIFCWLIIPLIFFYHYEETRIKMNIEENTVEDMKHFASEEENGLIESSNINPSPSYQEASPLNLNLVKNYFYYLISLIGMNIIYIISFKVIIYNTQDKMSIQSIIPTTLQKLTHIKNDFELLIYLNFAVLVFIAKLLYLVYLPYGAGKLTATFIERMKTGDNLKQEYSHLNDNFNKNYETIKHITSHKLMTGRVLTKKEKMLLKSCKENETILQHKQEVLEDKYSNFQMLLYYLLLPFKFIFVFLSISFVIFFVISKILVLYEGLTKSECGLNCAYLFNSQDSGLSLESILSISTEYIQLVILLIMFFYFMAAAFKGLKDLGIIRYTVEDIKNNKTLKVLFYSIFFLINVAIVLEIFSILPYYSFFHNFKICDINSLEDNSHCEITTFGIFYMKFYMNFRNLKYFDNLCSVCSTVLFFSMILYYPIKTVVKQWTSEAKKYNS